MDLGPSATTSSPAARERVPVGVERWRRTVRHAGGRRPAPRRGAELVVADLVEMPGGVDGPLVVDHRFGRGEGTDRRAPPQRVRSGRRARGHPTFEKCSDSTADLGVVARAERLVRLAGLTVQPGSHAVRQAVVHDVADQAVAEPVAARAVGVDEAAQQRDRRLIEFEPLPAQQLLDDGTPEAPAEHGGVDSTRFDSGSSASTWAASVPCSDSGTASSEPSSWAAVMQLAHEHAGCRRPARPPGRSRAAATGPPPSRRS